MNEIRQRHSNTIFENVCDDLWKKISYYCDNYMIFVIGKFNKSYPGYRLLTNEEIHLDHFKDELAKYYTKNNGIYSLDNFKVKNKKYFHSGEYRFIIGRTFMTEICYNNNIHCGNTISLKPDTPRTFITEKFILNNMNTIQTDFEGTYGNDELILYVADYIQFNKYMYLCVD